MSTACDLVSFRWSERVAPDTQSLQIAATSNSSSQDSNTRHKPSHSGDLLRERDGRREDLGDPDVSNQSTVSRISPAQKTHYINSNPTLWIGVQPETLTALELKNVVGKIRALLDGLGMGRVDIAFREKDARLSAKPLWAPVHIGPDLEPVIHKGSTALSLYIANLDGHMAGTCGPYFRVGEKLYTMTARHVLFSWDESRTEYRYHGNCFKHVSCMFSDQAQISVGPEEGGYIDGQRNIRQIHRIYRGSY